MQFRGYHINNLKSYRKYFCLSDAVDALENGTYGEWLSALSGTMEERESAVSEDSRAIEEIQVIEEIRLLLRQHSESGSAEQPGWDEESCRNLFLLFYKLAHLPVTDRDMEEINRLARLEAKKQEKEQAWGENRPDAGVEILLTGKEYRLPAWKRGENHQPFIWKKIINSGSFPVSVRIVYEGRGERDGQDDGDGHAKGSRRLNPGGYAWMLTQNGCFAGWGRRVRVDQRSFACVDRKGCLTVDGFPMQGDGMVDFSFDRRTGILGVDRDGGLRQYSCLELERETGNEERFAVACLKGKEYLLVKEDGTLITNLADGAGNPENICEVFFPSAEEKRCELPFPAMVVSVSDQLIGFETPDSRVGVWDREQGRLAWMEGAE